MRKASVARVLAVISATSWIAIASGVGCGNSSSPADAPDGSNILGGETSSSSSSSSGASSSASSSSTSSGGTTSSSSSSGTSGTTSSSGTSGTSSTSSSSSGGEADADIPDVQFFYDAPNRDGALNGDSACAESSATATLRPLDMFVMLDRSGSMGNDCSIGSNGTSKWCRAINSLSSYFNSAASDGNAAALQYFGLQNGACDGTNYNTSQVPGGSTGYTTLHTNAFDNSLETFSPVSGLGTPTEGALRGIISFTGKVANQRAGHTTIGILITDGDPNGCVQTLTSLRDLLQTHYDQKGIRTYLVGMDGATFSNLETIAAGGNAPVHASDINGLTGTCGNGANTCRHWNVGTGNGQVFVEALKAIQQSAIGCTYNMPTTDAGVINPDNVSVEYLAGGNEPGSKLQRVTNEAACVANGWYYDNNAAPTSITLCSAQCTTVQADATAKVRVLLGCLGG